MAARRSTPLVLLIREWEQQLSSSGCCGRIEGEFLERDTGGRCFEGRREEMEEAGRLYRAIRERYGDRVDVRIVDPRNLVSLLPMLLREFWTRRLRLREALRTLVGLSVSAVIVNGRLHARGRWPAAEEIFRLLDARLDRPAAAQPLAGTASTSISSARSSPSSPGPPPR